MQAGRITFGGNEETLLQTKKGKRDGVLDEGDEKWRPFLPEFFSSLQKGGRRVIYVDKSSSRNMGGITGESGDLTGGKKTKGLSDDKHVL